MPNYHLSIKIFSRGKGHSAIEKAAYRAGEKLFSNHNGKLYDYTRKGGVVHTEILLPEHAPREYADRSVLWNAVEQSERNDNAQLAREIEFSLPRELSIEQNIELAQEFVQKTFVSAGMCADVCVHDKGDGNPHAHVMLTLRPIELDGRWGAKSKKEYILDEKGERIRLASGEYKSRKVYTVDWNEPTRAEDWRKAWADTANAALSLHGITETLDHRSYVRQGVDKVPSVHLGSAASQMERKGIVTDRGDHNRRIEVTNKQLSQQRARIKHALDYLCSVPLQNAPSMLTAAQRVADANSLRAKTQKYRLNNFKRYAETCNFLMKHHINDGEQLYSVVKKISDRHVAVATAIKEKTRRLKTLEKHLLMNECLKVNKGVYQKYAKLDPKKRDGYKAKHSEEIRLYEEARNYFKGVMNGRKDPLPVKNWKKEWETLTAEKYDLVAEYYNLADEIKAAETVIRGLKMVEQDEPQRTQPKRTQEMEL